jgi:predicted cupin superfamily sugar epimerase
VPESHAARIIEALGLEPHPEGGYFSETYRHQRAVGDRSLCTAIYYVVTAQSPSRMHRVVSDEIWHFYAGDALEMLQLRDGAKIVAIGADVVAGQRPQVFVPAGIWQGARVKPGGSYALVGATVSPGFSYDDFEIGDREELVAKYPECAALITALTSD